MKTTFALGTLAALCQVAYSLQNRKYVIIPAIQSAPPPLPIGFNDDGPTSSLVSGGRNHIWTFENTGGDPNIFTISQDNRFVQCDSEEGCYVSAIPAPDSTFRVQENDNGIYTIEIPSPIWPSRAWTISGTTPGSKVELRIMELPRPEQGFRLIPLLED